MAGFTMTEAQEILKRDYLPVIREQLPTRTPLYSRITKGTEDVVGSEARLSLRIGRNQGVGARGTGQALPVAGGQRYKQIGVETKNIYGRLMIDGKIFKAAKSNQGAFLNAVEGEMKGLLEGLQWDLNRELFNTAKGTLATVAAVTGNTLTITASNASYKTRWVYKDEIIDIFNEDDSVVALGRTITAVSKSASTITVDGAAVTVAAGGGYITRAGARTYELIGLTDVMTPNTSLYGIDRSLAANAYFNPQVLGNSGTNRAISEVLLQTALDEAEINAGANITLMISSHGVRRAYQDLLQALKRYVEPKQLAGGWSSLDYNGLPWVTDPDCAANKIYMLDESTFKIHTMIPEVFIWGEEDNLILRQVIGYDAYEAFMVGYLELVCDTPAKQVVLADITEK